MSDNIIQQNTHIIQLRRYDVGIMSNFGKWLKATRQAKKMSGVELEKISKVSRQYISNLERELKTDVQRKLVQPSLEKVDALAKALGADIDEARLAAGYAPAADASDFDEKVRVAFQGAENFDDAEKARVLEAVKVFVAGVRAEKQTRGNQ